MLTFNYNYIPKKASGNGWIRSIALSMMFIAYVLYQI